EPAGLGFGGRRGHRLVLAPCVVTPRQQPGEALSDGHDRARRILDDAEDREARREVGDSDPQRDVPVALDDDQQETEDAGEQRARYETDSADDEREDDRETRDHLET